MSEDTTCNEVWMAWDNACEENYDDECISTDLTFREDFTHHVMVSMQNKKTKNAAFRHKIMASKKNAKTALLGKTETTQQEESGFDYSGVIMATSFTVLGAVAAGFAIKKCAGKKQE